MDGRGWIWTVGSEMDLRCSKTIFTSDIQK